MKKHRGIIGKDRRIIGKDRLTITVKELALFPDWEHMSRSSLYRLSNRIRSHVKKVKGQPLTLWDIASYLRVPREELQRYVS